MILAALALTLVSRQPPVFRFEIDPEKTYTKGTLRLQFWTSGQMVGDFDAKANPDGTRTSPGRGYEPGLANEPILARTAWNLEASGEFHSAGTFALALDSVNKSANLYDYRVERLAEGPVKLQGHYRVLPEHFRTGNPDTSWNVDDPLTRQTTVSLVRLRLAQSPGVRTGTLTDIGNGWARVSVNFMATITIDVFEFDQESPLEFPVAASLVGNVRLVEMEAEFGYPLGTGGDNLARNVNKTLQDFQIYLDHPSQGQAGFRLFQTVDRFSVSLNGRRQFSAKGVADGHDR